MTRPALILRDVVRHVVSFVVLAAVGSFAAGIAWAFIVGSFALLSLTQ